MSKTENPKRGRPEKEPNTCPVCGASKAIVCLLIKSHVDQRGVGYKGLICTKCGTVRVAKGRDGRFVYGYEEKWHLQE